MADGEPQEESDLSKYFFLIFPSFSFFYQKRFIIFTIMEKEQKIMHKMKQSVEREARKQAGYFDGRFAPKVMESKKHKKPKHKKRIFE